MTNQRIRYSKANQGVMRSRRNFITGQGKEVMVELNLNVKKYRILDSVSGEEVASGGNTRNVSVLKIQAKRGLTDLGVVFQDETRKERTKLPVGAAPIGHSA